MKSAEAAAKENPALLKGKVKVKDYEKLDKLNQKTQAELKKCKTTAQVNNVMDKYRKQRNIILGAGAVAVVTLGTLFVYSKKKGKQNEAELNKKLSEAKTQIAKLHEQNTKNIEDAIKAGKERDREKNAALRETTNTLLKLNKESEELFNKNKTLQSENIELQSQLEIAKAQIELLNNAASDSVSQSREFARNCMKLGAQMQRTSDARKAVYKTRNALEEARAAGDDKAVASLSKSLSNAKLKANYSASKVLDKRDAVLVSENKEYKRLGRMIEDTKKVLKSGKDAAGNPIDVEDVQNDLNRLIAKQRSILYDAREKYREAHKNVKFVR